MDVVCHKMVRLLRFFLYAIRFNLLFCVAIFASPLPSLQSGSLRPVNLSLYIESFLNNTEYFNKIQEGETHFGFHFLPTMQLLLARPWSFRIGCIWQKKFGAKQPWSGIFPALSLCCYTNKQHAFVIGIFGDVAPTLIEPLFDPIHLLQRPFMEGLHFKLVHNKSYIMGWLDWQTCLSKRYKQPENFVMYLDTLYHIGCLAPAIAVYLPFQLAIYHLGGQGIPVKDYSLFCTALGLAWDVRLYHVGVHWDSYLLGNNYVKKIDRPFKRGWGQWHRVDITTPYINLALHYWYGSKFSSENMGVPLYQSVRLEQQNEKNSLKATHYETKRSLLFLSLYKHWIFDPNVKIEAAVTPYYDFVNQLLEYGFSLKLSYKIAFQLTKLKPAEAI